MLNIVYNKYTQKNINGKNMNRQFLENIIDAYVLDRDIHSKNIVEIKENLVYEISDLMKLLYETDIELYDMIYDRTKLFQQQVIYNYLDNSYIKESNDINNEENVLVESLGVVLGATGVLGVIGSLLFPNIPTYLMRGLYNIGSLVTSIGASLIREGRYFKFRYSIIQRNVNECYIKCKVSPDDINLLTYLNTSHNNPILTNEKQITIAKCLRDCYVEYYIESTALSLQRYLVCLKNTGQLSNVSGNEDISKILSVLNVGGEQCKEFYENVNDMVDNFYTLIDFVYGDRAGNINFEAKEQVIKLFNNRLISAYKSILGSSSSQGYSKPINQGYSKPNYNQRYNNQK